jgi:hypothetical protein
MEVELMANGNKQLEANNLKVIKDQLEAEALMNKKYSEYSHRITDPQIKSLCNEGCQIHKQNFNDLKTYLDSHQ